MAKTESAYYSNLSIMLRDHKKTMLSRDKLFLGCDAEANAAAELEFQEEEIFWTAADASSCTAAAEDQSSAKNSSSSKIEEPAPDRSPSPFSISTIHRSSRRALDSLDSGYGLAALSSTTTTNNNNNSNNILIMNHHHHHGSSKVLFRQQSAPVNVPDWSKILGTSGSAAKSSAIDNNEEPKKQKFQNKTKNNFNNSSSSNINRKNSNSNSSSNKRGLFDSSFEEEEDEEEGQEEEQRLPPHELVAKEYARSMTFSVYEGAGHTLKGRDLSRVRNAVLKQTGFL